MATREQFVWVEKYRPATLDECILPKSVTAMLSGIIEQGNVPNLLFAGKPGTGKTTAAKVLLNAVDAEYMVINASDENGIDVLRTKIKDFASALSLDGNRKYVLLDEADYLHPQSTQPAFRSFIEEFAAQCGFILTANYPQRIIPPLHSRFGMVEFKIPAPERTDIAIRLTKRATEILKTEGVTFDPKIVAEVVKMFFPDFRRVINQLQQYSSSGELSQAILSQMNDKDIAELFAALKSKDYTNIRKWVGTHEDLDATAFYRMLSEQLPKRVNESALPSLIVQAADYGYRAAFCADQQLNTLAVLTEIMHEAQGQFK